MNSTTLTRAPGTRSPSSVRQHYEVEKALATRLRDASREERRALYPALYDELLRRVPDHPLLHTQRTPESVALAVEYHIDTLRPFINANTTFLEVGCGDCSLSLALAPRVKQLYAIDVSTEITSQMALPPNFQLRISDGTSIPVPAGSVDVAFSNQLMEHLHPDDALEQLLQIFAALAPGGRYLCVTPNRLNGPHDVSQGFDATATGLHLHEYTVRELVGIMKKAGFRRVQAYFTQGHLSTSTVPAVALETALWCLPGGLRHKLASTGPLRKILGIKLLATK
jgi:SAM-dependent methyltransferase